MAIIQISKIQQRSGNLVDLPQLDEAQFGWATDAKRLFIGKTTPNENIEVLTSYSNISFSQIDGSNGGNFNIGTATNGQTLTYVALTNTWENWTGNSSQLGNAKLQLGDASNISIEGGATGYILETDGVGNLAWTSKGTLRSTVYGLSTDTPVIMTVANTTPYTNALAVTVSGAVTDDQSNVDLTINGQTFYIKVAVDFPTSGNVELYTTQDLNPANAVIGTNIGVYTANTGIATALISGGGVSNAGGSVNTIQFNNSGVLDGSANFTLTGGNAVTLNGTLSVTGNANVGNIGATNIVGTLTTASQPNITSTGTLASLSVSGNTNAGNINVTGNITPSANVTYDLGNSTNAFRDLYLSGTSIKLGTQTVTSNASGVALSNAIFTTTVSASGNANIGNIGTAGLITATGNITGGNLITAGLVSATGNGTFGNVTATTFTGALSGAATSATTAGTVTTNAQPNITSVGILTSVSVSGNANVGNVITAGIVSATGNGTFGNVTATTFTGALSGAATTASTVTTAAQPNITSIGTLTSVSVSGNANVGNLGTSGLITATGNVTAGNIVTSGIVSASGNASVLGIKTDNYYYANGVSISFAGTYSNSNVAAYLPTYTGNITAGNISATGNITAANFVGSGNGSPTINSSSTLSISATSGVTINNITSLSTGSNSTAGTITGNWSLTSGSKLTATYADLAEYYEADAQYELGTVLEFGGEKEVTIAEDGTTRVAGVVSTNPAYVMNQCCKGIAVAIALQGRVPTKVRGKVRKGDLMVSAGNGFARPWNNAQPGMIIGKSIENFDGVEGIIEVAIGRL